MSHIARRWTAGIQAGARPHGTAALAARLGRSTATAAAGLALVARSYAATNLHSLAHSRYSSAPLPLLHRRHASSSSAPTLSLSAREKAVLKLLQSIRLPSASPDAAGGGGDDIVFSGHLRSVSEREGIVSVVLPLDDHYRALKRSVTEALEKAGPAPAGNGKLDWLKGVRVVMEAAKGKAEDTAAGSRTSGKVDGLAQVRNIIAVSSCKGGVGKSTVAVNLAYALQKIQIADSTSTIDSPSSSSTGAPLMRDLRVGILDADIYGPSLPTMVSPRDSTLRYDESRRIIPPVYQGIKTMSYGYVKPSQAQQAQQAQNAGMKGAGGDASANAATDAATAAGAFIRGPLASAAVKQLASETDWGALDYLVVDLPPGTGDVSLTLTQLLRIRAAVVVTTPQRLSFVDVVKGLQMFARTNVPVLAIVENMSYFVCDNCDTKHRVFGDEGAKHMEQIQRKFGKMKVVEVPIWKQMAQASDSGDPLMLSHDAASAPIRALYADLAESIHREISEPLAQIAPPTLTYDANTGMCTLQPAASQVASASSSSSSSAASSSPTAASPLSPPAAASTVSAFALRVACQCAGCVDELSGARRLDPSRVPKDVRPIGIQPRGNYACAVHWSDGHASSIYPFDAIRKLAATATATAPLSASPPPSRAPLVLVALLALLCAPLAALSQSVIFSTTSTVRRYVSGTGCSGGVQRQYYALNTNACTSEQGTNSMRVTCGAGIVPRLEIFANNASCPIGAATTDINGTIAVPYVATAEGACMSGGDFDYTIQCEEEQGTRALQVAYTDSSCTQRQTLLRAPPPAGLPVPLGACLGGSVVSFASYLATENNRYFQYQFNGPNCAVENYTSISIISAGQCVQDVYYSYLGPNATTTYFIITAAADATLRGPAPPTAWPPAADNTLMYNYQCSDANCGVNCRVSGVTRLGFCRKNSASSMIQAAYATTLCSADTLTAGLAAYSSPTCAASSLFSTYVAPAGNKCINGAYRNCGNGMGVAPPMRIPSLQSTLVSFTSLDTTSCTGPSYTSATFYSTDRCIPLSNGPYVQFVANTTSNVGSMITYAAATSGPQCQEANITASSPQHLGMCSSGIAFDTVAQAAALGFVIDTTTISNGVNGNGQIVVVPTSSSSSSSTGVALGSSGASIAASTGAAVAAATSSSTGSSLSSSSSTASDMHNDVGAGASSVAVSVGSLFVAALLAIFAQRA